VVELVALALAALAYNQVLQELALITQVVAEERLSSQLALSLMGVKAAAVQAVVEQDLLLLFLVLLTQAVVAAALALTTTVVAVQVL
jgi:hypothetical protein